MRRDLLVLVSLIAVLGALLRPPAPKVEPPKNPGCEVVLMAIGDLPENLLERFVAQRPGLVVGWRHIGLELYIEDIHALDPDRVLDSLGEQAEGFGARKIAVTTLPLENGAIAAWNEKAAILSIEGAPEGDEEPIFRLLERALDPKAVPPVDWSEI